jgi:hypothetical protein
MSALLVLLRTLDSFDYLSLLSCNFLRPLG